MASESTPNTVPHRTDVVLEDTERTPCEVWTRVMGYHRPVASFNGGKRSEYAERVCFTEPSGDE